jgi:ABC-type sulfate transport system permease subunit
MAAIDVMLFGAESTVIGWAISIPVAAVFSIASALIQKHGFKDEWGLAIGKALLIGCLTAIPWPIGAVVPLVGGVLGLMAPKSPS